MATYLPIRNTETRAASSERPLLKRSSGYHDYDGEVASFKNPRRDHFLEAAHKRAVPSSGCADVAWDDPCLAALFFWFRPIMFSPRKPKMTGFVDCRDYFSVR